MIPNQAKRLLPVLICLCLVAGGAGAQTIEQTQEQLVDSMTRTGQEVERANKKLKAADTAGACVDLRAASADSARTIELGEHIGDLLKTDTSVSDINRDRMRLDLVKILTNFTLQKRSLDAQIAEHCS